MENPNILANPVYGVIPLKKKIRVYKLSKQSQSLNELK